MVVEKLNLNQRVVCGVQKDFAATQQGAGLRWIYFKLLGVRFM